MRLLDADDAVWLARVLDALEASVGEPWRLAVERLEAVPAPAYRLRVAIAALRRLLGGRARHVRLAKQIRSRVLGAPVLTPTDRAARIDRAARELGLTSDQVEVAMWADLALERPVELIAGRPDELAVLALANLQLVQRALGRARHVALRVGDGATTLVRAAATLGLLTTATRDGEATVLEIVGPLALCHHTAVYGRALGRLAPLLAGCGEFSLAIESEAGKIEQLASPAMLPDPSPHRFERAVAIQLARALERRGHAITRVPQLVTDREVVCPDLLVDGRPLEVVGFWTADYLALKLARYRAAGVGEPILCIDAARACSEDELPTGHIVRYRRAIPVEEVIRA